jgi:hypothetical protein
VSAPVATTICFSSATFPEPMYVAGSGGSGNDWRIEKRLLTTGALDNGFGTSGVVTEVGSGYTSDLVKDSTYMYVFGVDGPLHWRIGHLSNDGLLQ